MPDHPMTNRASQVLHVFESARDWARSLFSGTRQALCEASSQPEIMIGTSH